MRVETNGESEEFSELLLKIGDGVLSENKNIGESMVELPSHFFTTKASATELVDDVFPEFEKKHKNTGWAKNRAILCPTNEECSEINKILLREALKTRNVPK